MPDPDAPLAIAAAGDSALIVTVERRIDPAVNARVVRLAHRLRSLQLAGVRDVVSSYGSVAVYFDPLRTDLAALHAAIARGVRPDAGPRPTRPPIVVPVCYGGELGPDLAEVAAFAKCSEAEVVRRHSERVYRVYLLGFVPGFAYMGSVDPRIAMPRRDSPRLAVPAGSIGVAGEQTGVYPTTSPGGWRLLGRTSLKPFDASRSKPFLFEPGDHVRFEPVDEATLRERATRED